MTSAGKDQTWVIDTKELGRQPGRMVELERTIDAPELIGTDVVAVPQGQPIDLKIRLESVLEGVYVSGSAHTTATGACVRCLDDVQVEVDVQFQELFAYADRAAHHHEVAGDDDTDEVLELDGDDADLEPVLRDAVVTELPFQPVCREDCPGLCSECGVRLADHPGHQHENIDPRWGALAALQAEPAHDDEKRN